MANIREIAERLNLSAAANNYKISKLQEIRKERLKLKRTSCKTIFSKEIIGEGEDWAYHYGGRSELQFNIGFEEKKFRYGVAFSFRTSRDPKIRTLDSFVPKLQRFNQFLRDHPELWNRYEISQFHINKKSFLPIAQKSDIELIPHTFVFFGVRIDADSVNYENENVLKTFDDLLAAL